MTNRSRDVPGKNETIKYYKTIGECYSSNAGEIQRRLESIIIRDGEVTFDWVLDIIREQEHDGHKISTLEEVTNGHS